MTSKTFVSGTTIDSAWLNDVNDATYEGTAVYTPAGTGAVATTIQNKLQESVSVKDFGAVGDGVTDDTGAIQAAIDRFSTVGGVLLFPVGVYKVTQTLNVNKPLFLEGAGSGSVYQPTQAPATKIVWAGAVAGTVVNFGGFGATFSGGGISALMIDGSATASICLYIMDCQRGLFRGVTLTGASVDALYFTNTAGQEPTGFHIFDDLRIQLRGGPTNAANGIKVDGVSSGADGVTLCTFRRARIDHANGSGVVVQNVGDFFMWESLQTFRADVETGPGVWFSSTSASAICGGHTFQSCNVSAGYRFEKAGLHLQTRIINTGHIDINSGAVVLFGAGSADVVCDTGLGFNYGRGLIPNLHSMLSSDSMSLVRHDTTNAVLHTAQGNWKTAMTGTGSISESGQSGSGTRLVTGAVTNDFTAVYDVQTIGNGDGMSSTYSFALDFLISLITTTNVMVKIGAADSNTAAATNGVFMKFDPAVSAFWQAVTVVGGVSTVTTTTLAGGLGKIEFYIYVAASGGSVSFYYRAANNRLFAILATHTTNIPSSALQTLVRVQTNTSSAALVDVYGVKMGTVDEV